MEESWKEPLKESWMKFLRTIPVWFLKNYQEKSQEKSLKESFKESGENPIGNSKQNLGEIRGGILEEISEKQKNPGEIPGGFLGEIWEEPVKNLIKNQMEPLHESQEKKPKEIPEIVPGEIPESGVLGDPQKWS